MKCIAPSLEYEHDERKYFIKDKDTNQKLHIDCQLLALSWRQAFSFLCTCLNYHKLIEQVFNEKDSNLKENYCIHSIFLINDCSTQTNYANQLFKGFIGNPN
jgi:hypothetical protein